MQSKRGFFIRCGISLAVLGGLMVAIRGEIVDALRVIQAGVRWDWFFYAILVYLVALALVSRRLQLIYRSQDVKLTFRQTFYLTFLGLFFTLFLPSAFGGDLAKGYYAYQYSGRKLGSTTGIILDRLVGFLSLFPIALTALLVYGRTLATPVVEQSVYGAMVVFASASLFFTSRRIAKRFNFLFSLIPDKWRSKCLDLYYAIRSYRNHLGTFGLCFLISLLAQLCFYWDVYLLARSIGIDVSIWPYLALVPLIGFVSLAPSLSGLGVREAGFVFFFRIFMPVEKALALSIIYDILFYGSALLAGIVFAFRGGLRKEVIHDLEIAGEKLQEA